VPETVGLIAGLDDVAVMGQPVQERRGHLGVAEDAGPFPEGEVGGDHHAGVLVELGEEVEEQGPARLAEGQCQATRRFNPLTTFGIDPLG